MGDLDGREDPIVSYVAERDVDLLLLEELWTSEAYHEVLLQRVGVESSGWRFIDARQSVTSANGESDIVAKFEAQGRRLAILIEDKVDAPFQPEQAQRYRLRGRAGCVAGEWSDFRTVLVAPRNYLARPEAALFDATCSYEDLVEHFHRQVDTPRVRFKAAILRLAIDHARRGYVGIPDAQASALWAEYFEIAALEAPRLGMRRPGPKPAGSLWVMFSPQTLPVGCVLRHKLPIGSVDLQLPAAVEPDAIAHLLEGAFTLVPTGLSYSVRRGGVPPVTSSGPASSQHAAIREGLRGAEELLSWAEQHRDALSPR